MSAVAVAAEPQEPFRFAVTFANGKVCDEAKWTEQDVYDRVAMLVRLYGPYQDISFQKGDPIPELTEIAHS